MSEKPEALRMADQLDRGWAYNYECFKIAAELRRLYELALEQQGKIYALEMARSMEQKTAKLKQDALFEALRPFVTIGSGFDMEDVRKARAAIKMAEEGK